MSVSEILISPLAGAALEAMPVAVLYTDTDGTIRYANRAAMGLLRIPRSALGHVSIREFCPLPLVSLCGRSGERAVVTDATGREVPVEICVASMELSGERWFSISLRDCREIVELERRLELERSRLRSLRSIDLAIGKNLDLNETLEVILDHVTGQLGVDAAAILLLDANGARLEFAAARGFRTDALKYTNLPVGASYAGRAAEERRIVRIERLGSARGFAASPLLREEKFASYFGIPLAAKGEINGVLELFTRSEFSPGEELMDSATAIARQTAIAVDNASLLAHLKQSNDELSRAYETTLDGWSRALDLRDRETEGHSRRVADLALQLSRELGVPERELIHFRRGALLHDIGKMGIPDGILLKAGPLDKEEWMVMRRHPEYARNLLEPIRYLRPALDIPYCHHERWDGSGYPQGLAGEQIPLSARIFTVVDVWDALTSERPYRRAWSSIQAVGYIEENAGSHFDPGIIKPFLSVVSSLW